MLLGVKFGCRRLGNFATQKATTECNHIDNIMSQLPELINQASVICGNDSRLAERLSIGRQTVCQWRTGAKPCPPEDQARLAGIAGLDPLQALLVAHLERHAGTPKGEALLDVLGDFVGTNENAPESLQGRINWRKRKFSPRINHHKPGKRRVFSCHVSELLLGFVTR